jgi:hypothetical protein
VRLDFRYWIYDPPKEVEVMRECFVVHSLQQLSLRIKSIAASYLDGCIHAGRVRPRPRPRPWPSWPALSVLKLKAGTATILEYQRRTD